MIFSTLALSLAFSQITVRINDSMHYEKIFTADSKFMVLKPVIDKNIGMLTKENLNAKINATALSQADLIQSSTYCDENAQMITVDFLSENRIIFNDIRHSRCRTPASQGISPQAVKESQSHNVLQFENSGAGALDLDISHNISPAGVAFVKKVIADSITTQTVGPDEVSLESMTATNKDLRFYPILPPGLVGTDWAANISYEIMKPYLLPGAPVLQLLPESNVVDFNQ